MVTTTTRVGRSSESKASRCGRGISPCRTLKLRFMVRGLGIALILSAALAGQPALEAEETNKDKAARGMPGKISPLDELLMEIGGTTRAGTVTKTPADWSVQQLFLVSVDK